MDRSRRSGETGSSGRPKARGRRPDGRDAVSRPDRAAKPVRESRDESASRATSRTSSNTTAKHGGRRPSTGSPPARTRGHSDRKPADKGNQVGGGHILNTSSGAEAIKAARRNRRPAAAGTARSEVHRASSSARGAGGSGSSGIAHADGTTSISRSKGRHREVGRKSIAGRIAGVTPRTVILLVLLVMFIVLSVSPVTRNLEATGRLNRMKAELKKEKAATESLEKEVKEAGSPDYVAKEARKQHMVAPGEIPVLVTTDQPERDIQYRVKALQSMEEAWARVRQILHSVPRQQ